MNQSLGLARIDYLGALRVRGADATRFLQGQVSNDVAALAPGRCQLAGYHNPQGRAIAILRVVKLADDDLLAVLPRELAGPVAERLRRFVLRAKARVEDASGDWRISGIVAPAAPVVEAADRPALPAELHAARHADGCIALCIGEAPARWLLLEPHGGGPGAASGASALDLEAWRALDVEAGQPQVYAANSEAFVAQMLNLDALGGIAFDKGCYTGQEVIARAHYRGRVKRRMQRFRSTGPATLAPGDSGTLRDGRGFRVVEAAALADGRCEFLAVAPFGADAVADESRDAAGIALDCEALPLPYALPA